MPGALLSSAPFTNVSIRHAVDEPAVEPGEEGLDHGVVEAAAGRPGRGRSTHLSIPLVQGQGAYDERWTTPSGRFCPDAVFSAPNARWVRRG